MLRVDLQGLDFSFENVPEAQLWATDASLANFFAVEFSFSSKAQLAWLFPF